MNAPTRSRADASDLDAIGIHMHSLRLSPGESSTTADSSKGELKRKAEESDG
jgi:hypothetical protein